METTQKTIKGKLLKLVFKYEGRGRGPLWKVYEQLNPDAIDEFWERPITVIMENFEDSIVEGETFCKWFTEVKAERFANKLKVELEIV